MELTKLGWTPISAEQPAGTDIRYDPLFQGLQQEMEKLATPSAQDQVDWTKVLQWSVDILSSRSKDLLVAGYLVLALLHTRKLPGFALGMTIYGDLLHHFWDELFPAKQRMRGRVQSLCWCLERSEAALRLLPESSWEGALSARVREALEAIELVLKNELEEPPSLTPLKDLCAERKAPSEEGIPTGQSLAPPIPSVEVWHQALPDTATASAHKGVESALQQLQQSAAALWEADPRAPDAYRLFRAALWSPVTELPPAVQGKTRISPPEARLGDALRELRRQADPEPLLRFSETRLSQFLFWLDLNRFSFEALSRLGEPCQQARDAVWQESAYLAARLPGLIELSFSDGTPFADLETREWLTRRPLMSEGFPNHPAPMAISGANAEEEQFAAAYQQALSLSAMGKFVEAVEHLQRKVAHGSTQREKLLWKMTLVQVLIDSRRGNVALPLLDQLVADLDRHALERYDPPLALKALKLTWQGYEAQGRFKERAESILHRIGRLDLAEMIRLEATSSRQ